MGNKHTKLERPTFDQLPETEQLQLPNWQHMPLPAVDFGIAIGREVQASIALRRFGSLLDRPPFRFQPLSVPFVEHIGHRMLREAAKQEADTVEDLSEAVLGQCNQLELSEEHLTARAIKVQYGERGKKTGERRQQISIAGHVATAAWVKVSVDAPVSSSLPAGHYKREKNMLRRVIGADETIKPAVAVLGRVYVPTEHSSLLDVLPQYLTPRQAGLQVGPITMLNVNLAPKTA